MSDNENFLIVNKHINRMDYCALLAGGAPDDEFDSESGEISTRIRFEKSVQELADIIAEVFNAGFNEHDDTIVFLVVAQQIKNELTS